MIYTPAPRKLSAFLAIFLLLCLAGCARETPSFPVSDQEEIEDVKYLSALYNTRAVNTVTIARDDLDYNRTRGRTVTRAERISKELRLQVVGNRILMATYPLCPQKFRSRSMMVGIAAHSMDYPRIIWAVTPFGQEDKATLKLGDAILGMGNEDIEKGIGGAMRARSILAGSAVRSEPLKFRVQRDDEILRITQAPQNFCNYKLVLNKTSDANAYADDISIHVNTRLMDALATDDELAAIIGHEATHNVMRHNPKEKLVRIVDYFARMFGRWGQGRLDSAAELMVDRGFSRQFEGEADYIGVYIAAMAGYDPAAALSSWQTMAAFYPDLISYSDQDTDVSVLLQTHPDFATRYTQLRKAVEQIKLKQSEGLPVLPDFLY